MFEKAFLTHDHHPTPTKPTSNATVASRPIEQQVIRMAKKQRGEGGREEQTMRLATRLSGQVELDAQLRPVRIAFHAVTGEEKWKLLQQELERSGVALPQQHLKELMRISPDEHNPFSLEPADPADLARLLGVAQGNWEERVHGCVKGELKGVECGLDLGGKGWLGVEDLVCFLNLHTGHLYRNRDLSLVFRRMQLQSAESGPALSY
jgi:hypothetical protein